MFRANLCRRCAPLLIGILLFLAGCADKSQTVQVQPSSTPDRQAYISATLSPLPPPTEEAISTPPQQTGDSSTTGLATPSPVIEPTSTAPIATGDNDSHPYLLFNGHDLGQYKQDIQTDSLRQQLFIAIKDYIEANESSSMLTSAFFFLITDDSVQLSQARNMLMDKVAEECWASDDNSCPRDLGASGVLFNVSLTYDWLYPHLSISERERVKARIALDVCRYYEAFTYGTNNIAEGWSNWWTEDYTQNHFHASTGSMMLGALAIRNNDAPTCVATDMHGQQKIVTVQEILEFGLQKMERNYEIFNRISDGSYPEGDSYVVVHNNIYLSALWATERLLSPEVNLIGEKQLKKFPLFYLFNSPPGQLWNQLTNHGDYFTSSRENYLFPKDLQLSATVNQNPLAAWIAQQYYYDKDGQIKIPFHHEYAIPNTVLHFIFSDPDLNPLSPSEVGLDLSYHASDWEGVFMRSDWSSTAVAAAIKTGPPGGHTAYNLARRNFTGEPLGKDSPNLPEFELSAQHMHPDANGIYLYANGTFLLPEMMGLTGDDTPWGRYTSSHNTILISDNSGEMRGQIQGDDIGGVTFGYNGEQGGEYFWDIETQENEVGIIEHVSTQGYDYSLGQATTAYWPELGLKRFHRHVLFARDPGYMLVVDDLDAVSEKTYDWMGHSSGTVTQEGQWLNVQADNGQRLALAVVSPSKFTFEEPVNEWHGIKLEDIYRFRYVSENRTMYEWKIRQNCQSCRFITMLFPTDEARWNQKPTVTGLADTTQVAAVQIDFNDKDRVETLAISLTPGETLSVGNFTFNGRTIAVEKQDAAIQRILLAYGSILKEGDTVLIEDLPDSSFLEAQYERDKLIVRSPDPAGVTLFAPGVADVSWQRVDENKVIIAKSVSFTRNGDYITLSTSN